jgi:hypothetical protein
MKCLNLLQIKGAHLTGSFKLLSKELLWICWHECPLKYFPSDFTLDNLAVLDMQYSKLKELWKGKKVRNILQSLKFLQYVIYIYMLRLIMINFHYFSLYYNRFSTSLKSLISVILSTLLKHQTCTVQV